MCSLPPSYLAPNSPLTKENYNCTCNFSLLLFCPILHLELYLCILSDSDEIRVTPWYSRLDMLLPFMLFLALTTENSRFAVCHMHSAKDLPSVTLDKQHTTSTVSTNNYLSSVFYRTLSKWFAECQI